MTVSEATALLPPDAPLRDLLQAFADGVLADRALTPKEAAADLRVGRSTIYGLMAAGLPWHPVGNRGRGRRIYRTEMHDWVRGRGERADERRLAAHTHRAAGAAVRKRNRPSAASVADNAHDIRGGTDRESLRALVRRPQTNHRS